MFNELDRSAPYAPVNSVLSVVRRFRERGLPEPLTPQEITRVGVSEGNAGRTLQALRFLDLVDEEGKVTATFDRLRRATNSEYPEFLGDILRNAYHEVFQIIDPATASEIDINDAFRNYRPQAQRPRMVVLFTGLCREAGLMPGEAPEQRTRAKRSSSDKRDGGRTVRRGAPTRPLKDSHPANILVEQPTFPGFQMGQSKMAEANGGQFALLEGLLQELPSERQWTAKRRDKWLQAFTANLDLLVDVVEVAERPVQERLSLYPAPPAPSDEEEPSFE